MSSRHVRRLQQAQGTSAGPLEGVHSEDEEEEEEEGEVQQRPMFQFDDTDESSEEEEEEEEEDEEEEGGKKEAARQPAPKSAPVKVEEEESEDKLLDDLIALQTQQLAEAAKEEELESGFAIEARDLDFDLASRRRIGTVSFPVPGQGEGPVGPKGGTSSSSRGSKQKLLFGQPASHWSKPASHAFGGMSMSRVKGDSWGQAAFAPEYGFDVSKEMAEKHAWLEAIIASQCPNRLLLFTVHSHGQVPLSLHHLSMHFSGNAALSRELTRRALYLFDCALTDSFCSAVLQGRAAMNPHAPENAAFFQVLLRHLRQCASGAAGLDRKLGTATAVAKLILSLGRNWRNNQRRRGQADDGSGNSDEADPFGAQECLDVLAAASTTADAGPMHSLLPDPPSAAHVKAYRPMEESLADPRLLEFNPAVEQENAMVRVSVCRWGEQAGLGADGSRGLGADAAEQGLWGGSYSQLIRALQEARRPAVPGDPMMEEGPRVDVARAPRGAGQVGAWQAREAREAVAVRDTGRVDLEAPLLQLFLQTLLPWFHA